MVLVFSPAFSTVAHIQVPKTQVVSVMVFAEFSKSRLSTVQKSIRIWSKSTDFGSTEKVRIFRWKVRKFEIFEIRDSGNVRELFFPSVREFQILTRFFGRFCEGILILKIDRLPARVWIPHRRSNAEKRVIRELRGQDLQASIILCLVYTLMSCETNCKRAHFTTGAQGIGGRRKKTIRH